MRPIHALLVFAALAALTHRTEAAPIHDAARRGDVAQVKAILDGDASQIERRDERGGTPLIVAAASAPQITEREPGTGAAVPAVKFSYRTNEAIARLLLERGANPGATDENGQTPLHLAAAVANAPVVALLLAAKAPVDPRQKNGYTPLHFACTTSNHIVSESGGAKTYEFYDNVEAAKLLIAAGADVNATTMDKMLTPLMLAASDGVNLAVDALLAAHADFKRQSSDGMTALHFAAQGQRWISARIGYVGVQEQRNYQFIDNKFVIVALLKGGADPTAKNKEGKTPVELTKDKVLNAKAFEEFAKK